MAQLVFPYTQGETFVNRLLELGAGGWSVVDTALRDRPPASTEQVMHPQAYVDADQPRRVRIAPPGGGWRVLRGGTLGEWTTGKLLARAGGTAWTAAAAGWGGDRYALLGRGADRALVVRWVWDTPGDEREFLPALRDWVAEGKPDASAAASPPPAAPWRWRSHRTPRRRGHSRAARRPRPASRATSLPPCGAPVAQRSEQRAHNPTDGGSNPPRRISAG